MAVSWSSNLLHSGKYSDLTIRCGDREFSVHCNIVCTQSQGFDALVKDLSPSEDSPTMVLILDDDSETVKRALKFLYDRDFKATTAAEDAHGGNNLALVVHAQGFLFANKYQIPALKRLATAKCENKLEHSPDNQALLQSIKLLWEALQEDDDDNDNDNNAIKKVALDFASKFILHYDDNFNTQLKVLCSEYPNIGADILQEVARKCKIKKGEEENANDPANFALDNNDFVPIQAQLCHVCGSSHRIRGTSAYERQFYQGYFSFCDLCRIYL